MSVEHEPHLPARISKRVMGLAAKLPPGMLERLARNRPTIDGRRLEPEVYLALQLLNRVPGATFEDRPLPKARGEIDDEAWAFGAHSDVGRAEDLTIPTAAGPLPLRRYEPHPDRPGNGILVYFHGGGFVVGSRTSADSICRWFCARAGVTVASVDYRLAPEYRFPAAPEDALAAYRWIAEHCAEWGQPDASLLVGGDSAGGNLSAVTTLAVRAARRAGEHDLPPPRLSVLLYPWVDLHGEHPSHETFAEGYFLTRKQLRWYADHYVPNTEARRDPRVSPLLEEDLTDFGPAYVGVAGFDPLRDEGCAFGKRLAAAGNPTKLDIIDGVTHAYANTTGVGRSGAAALDRAVAAVRRHLPTS
jgi:acetyl esterase